MIKVTFTLLLVLLATIVQAQTKKNHAKTHYVDTAGHYYQQADLPVYLFISHLATRPKGAATCQR